MADMAFRLFGGGRSKPERAGLTPLERFVDSANRETGGPTAELARVYDEFRRAQFRRRA